ncbi:MAG: phosphatidate cytidylyltransferase [Lachnospiraceae bacterium]|nr:phosphatidate cytidylyltransferase [Lachnospiraceae bacterium]
MLELWAGTKVVLIYYIVAASTALVCRALIRIPDELFRKILHCILLGSLMGFVFGFETWWISAGVAVAFAVVVYPILAFFERFKAYSQLTTERKSGELKASLLLVFGMFATVIAICWGWLGDKYLVLASVYAWGFGDAAAALIGKRFGKQKIQWKYIDGKKSYAGTIAMFLTSFVSVLIVLACRGGLNTAGLLLTAAITAFVSAIAELYSKDGMDTVICPMVAMVTVLPLVYLFGGMT